jgi:peptidoglycan L-alanyl-D-glutamate endopeptidase CwlK
MRWDWPLFHLLAAAMKAAARELGVAIAWGGDWRTFKDGPHFELDRKAYP